MRRFTKCVMGKALKGQTDNGKARSFLVTEIFVIVPEIAEGSK